MMLRQPKQTLWRPAIIIVLLLFILLAWNENAILTDSNPLQHQPTVIITPPSPPIPPHQNDHNHFPQQTPTQEPSKEDPEETQTKKEQLTPFQEYLEEYILLHNEMTSGNRPGKYIKMVCDNFCGGWGDRLKGIYNVIALSLLTKRAFIIDLNNAGTPLSSIYKTNPINWEFRPTVGSSHAIHCIDNPNCDCVRDSLQLGSGTSFLEKYDEIVFRTNQDCSNFLTKLSLFETTRELFAEEDWRGKLFARFFQPGEELAGAIRQVLDLQGSTQLTPIVYPEIAVHIRTGIIPGDPLRLKAAQSVVVDGYVSCLEALKASLHFETSKVFVACDNQNALEELETKIREKSFQVIDAAKVGGLGHVERFSHVPGLTIRMHAEFEILRNAKYLIAGESGFSLYAFKLRSSAKFLGFAGYRQCEPLFSKGNEFTVFSDA